MSYPNRTLPPSTGTELGAGTSAKRGHVRRPHAPYSASPLGEGGPVIAAEAAIQKYVYCRTPLYAGVTGVSPTAAVSRMTISSGSQRAATFCSAAVEGDSARERRYSRRASATRSTPSTTSPGPPPTHPTKHPARRTDIGEVPPYHQQKHVLFGQQEGRCNGCATEFPFRAFTVDHIVPQSRGGTDHPENLQLLCSHCNSVKGNRPQEYLVARLRELGVH